MTVQEISEIAKGFSREEKVLLIKILASQITEDFNAIGIENIRGCLEEADAEIERGEVVSAEKFFKKLSR